MHHSLASNPTHSAGPARTQFILYPPQKGSHLAPYTAPQHLFSSACKAPSLALASALQTPPKSMTLYYTCLLALNFITHLGPNSHTYPGQRCPTPLEHDVDGTSLTAHDRGGNRTAPSRARQLPPGGSLLGAGVRASASQCLEQTFPS